MTDLIEIARISGPHGLKGKIKIIPFGDSFERFLTYKRLIIGKKGFSREILSAQNRRSFYIIELSGLTDISQVEPLKGETLFIKPEQLEEPLEDEYYWRDLLGLKVMDTQGAVLGEIVDIFSTGSNDVYVVDKAKRHYIPATKEVIKEISLGKGCITIDATLLEGLLD
jgi:16S rRNA processing protein RimM